VARTARPRGALAALGAAVLLLAAGCTSGSPGGDEPPASPSPSPTTSPTSSSASPPASPPATGAAPVPTLTDLGWTSTQAPSDDSVEVLPSAGRLGDSGRPSGPVLRVELRAGEQYVEGGDSTARAEVYGRNASPWSTPTAEWPDPPGSQRWYTFSLYLPPRFPTSTDPADWLVLTQWKGRDGGSPPVSIEVAGDRLRLGGERSNEGDVPDNGDLGPLPLGEWTTLTVGLGLSPDDGWLEVERDGAVVVPKQPLATMDVIDGSVDPVYLKQGIYRSEGWDATQTAYFSPVRVSDTEPAP
jgi:hypothetical protein